MRHRKAGAKLGRNNSHRKAMFKNMANSLLRHERIWTTLPKAKAIKSIAEKLITLGKRGDLHARRQAFNILRDKEVVKKLFSDLADRFKERTGGYTRVLKAGFRTGDNAPMSIIELVDYKSEPEEKKLEEKTDSEE